MNGLLVSPEATPGYLPARVHGASLQARHPGAAATWARRAGGYGLPARPRDPGEGLQGEFLGRGEGPGAGALTYIELGRRGPALGLPRSVAVDLFV